MEDSENIFHFDEIEESTSHSEPCKKKRRRKRKNDKGECKKEKSTIQQINDDSVITQINALQKELFDTKLKINNILSKLDFLKNSVISSDNSNKNNSKTNKKANNTSSKNNENITGKNNINKNITSKNNINNTTKNKIIKKIGNNIELKIKTIEREEDRCNISEEMRHFLQLQEENNENNEAFTIQTVVTRIHLYIRENNLQDMEKKNNILYDEHLKKLFKLKKNQKLTFFNLPKFIKKHIN